MVTTMAMDMVVRTRRTPRALSSLGSNVRPKAAYSIAVSGLLALVLGWLVVTTSIAQVFVNRRPDMALDAAPWNARAKGRFAERYVSAKPGSRELAKAWLLSVQALKRDSMTISALRNAGIILASRGEQDRAERVFEFAATLSKRDLGVNMWGIEAAVQRGDVSSALRYYDFALRTSARAGQILYPILARATDDPAIVRGLGPILAQNPPWSAEFLSLVAEQGPSSDAVFTLSKRWAGLAVQDNRAVAQKVITRLYRDKQFAKSKQIFYAAQGLAKATPAVFNGRFVALPLYSPFDWQLINDETSNAVVDRLNGRGALFSTIQTDQGVAATQTLTLAPGRHRLRSQAQSLTPGARPKGAWIIRCEDGVTDELARVPFVSRQGAELDAKADFIVPASGCRAQTLVLWRSRSGEEDPGLGLKSVEVLAI